MTDKDDIFDDIFDDDDEDITVQGVVLTDEDGEESEYIIIDEFDHGGEHFFIMVRLDEAEEAEVEGYVFKQIQSDDSDEAVFTELEPEEYEAIADIVKTRLDDLDIES